MEAGSALKMLRLAAWVVPAVSVIWLLAAGYLREKATLSRRPAGAVAWLALAAAVFTGLVAICLNTILYNSDRMLTVWVSVCVGAAVALAALLVTGHLRRGDAADGAWDEADAAVAALALGVLFGAYLVPKHTARPEAWLTAAALGAGAFAALFALACGLLRQDERSSLCRAVVRPLELVAVACAASALGMLVGKLHFPDIRHAGDVVTLWLTIALLVWLPLSLIQRFVRPTGAASALFLIIFAALTAWLAHLASKVNLLGVSSSQCFWAGLAAGLAAGLMHAAGLFRSAMARQAVTVSVLLALAAAALSLRLLTGFGIAACAAGMLAAIPGWALLASWQDSKTDDLFPQTLLWAPGFLICLTALRIWLAQAGSMNVAIFAPYPFLGLCIGIALPFAVWSLLPWSRTEGGGSSVALSAVGAAVALLAIAGATVAVAVVLREPAARLYLMGLAASGLAGALVSGSQGRDWAGVPVTVASLFAAILSVTVSRPLLDFTAEAGRPEKVRVLIVIFAVLIVLYAISETWRWLVARRSAANA